MHLLTNYFQFDKIEEKKRNVSPLDDNQLLGMVEMG